MSKKRSSASSRVTKPMRIFISHSHMDIEAVQAIARRLRSDGHHILMMDAILQPGDNIAQYIQESLARVDAIIYVISRNSIHSKWVQFEIGTIVLQQISKKQQRIIPVRLDDSEIPSLLADRLYIDLFYDYELGMQRLSEAFKVASPEAFESAHPKNSLKDTREAHVAKLRECLRKGRLTLFCGAGVSVGAKIPAWNDLLVHLLRSMMKKISQDHSLDIGEKAALEFQQRNSASSLILGKYLKNNLGRDFAKEVRDALYASNPTTCDLINSIVALARPQRDGRPLDSIVTFNFDGLVEEQLLKASIENKPLYSEAINHDSNEMPIYHVHGYLPRDGEVDEKTELVFSEDAYHSQFIDPFSWSNLIQLNKLTQNTCLFVGISLTDPNMRRLLDVAWRKNPMKKLGHYILKRLPKSKDGADVLDQVSKLLEEQDANALGLNVIWVEGYGEYDDILKSIAAPAS